MADKSAIEWTDATWNPVAGCSIVSPGCTNCYAMKMAARLDAMGQPIYAGMTKKVNGNVVWTGKVEQSNWGQVIKPTTWRTSRRVFVNSMSDLFHKAISPEIIDQCFVVMGVADHHEYQILTKRVDLAAEFLLEPLRVEEIYAQWSSVSGSPPEIVSWPMRHVLIGASVEDQARADERRDHLKSLAMAGWRTFVSYEPALGPVNWSGWEFISWMISGGESGPGARPTHPDWHRATRDWCADHRIPYLFKQWGSWHPEIDRDNDDPDWRQPYTRYREPGFQILNLAGGRGFHGDRVHVMRRCSKKSAGRLLDGKEHNEFPAAIAA